MTTIKSPYVTDGVWLRGNLHAHSTLSDGVRTPECVFDDYAARGYDFLAISDHDTLTAPTEIPSSAALELVPAVEISNNGPHLLHLGATEAITPHEDRQQVVDEISDTGGVAIPAHPNWRESFAHWPHDELERTTGYDAIEVYNGLIERHPGAANATDRWDRLLSTGRRVWGLANDDSHRPWDVSQAWNVVQVQERSPEAILGAIQAGNFYASTGVHVESIDVSGDRISIATGNAERIRLITDHGLVQQDVAGPSTTFRVPDQLVHRENHQYVRIECLGSGGSRAWLQPMFLS